MLGVLDQPKTLGLDPASPRPFRVRQRLQANADSFRLEIEPEGVATSCAFAAGQLVQPVLPFQLPLGQPFFMVTWRTAESLAKC